MENTTPNVIGVGPYKNQQQKTNQPPKGLNSCKCIALMNAKSSVYQFGVKPKGVLGLNPKPGMGSDKYFKLKDINVGPRDIQSLAKEVFEKKIEKNELKLEKKMMKAQAIEQLMREDIDADEQEVRKRLPPTTEETSQSNRKDGLMLWKEYEEQLGVKLSSEKKPPTQKAPSFPAVMPAPEIGGMAALPQVDKPMNLFEEISKPSRARINPEQHPRPPSSKKRSGLQDRTERQNLLATQHTANFNQRGGEPDLTFQAQHSSVGAAKKLTTRRDSREVQRQESFKKAGESIIKSDRGSRVSSAKYRRQMSGVKNSSTYNTAARKDSGLPPLAASRQSERSTIKRTRQAGEAVRQSKMSSQFNEFGNEFGAEDMVKSVQKGNPGNPGDGAQFEIMNDSFFQEKMKGPGAQASQAEIYKQKLRANSARYRNNNRPASSTSKKSFSRRSSRDGRRDSFDGRFSQMSKKSSKRELNPYYADNKLSALLENAQSSVYGAKPQPAEVNPNEEAQRAIEFDEGNFQFNQEEEKLFGELKAIGPPMADQNDPFQASGLRAEQSRSQFEASIEQQLESLLRSNHGSKQQEALPEPTDSSQNRAKPTARAYDADRDEMTEGRDDDVSQDTKDHYLKQFEQSKMDQSILENIDQKAAAQAAISSRRAALEKIIPGEYARKLESIDKEYESLLQDQDSISSIPQMQLGKYNDMIKKLEEMRKQVLREALDIEEELGIADSATDLKPVHNMTTGESIQQNTSSALPKQRETTPLEEQQQIHVAIDNLAKQAQDSGQINPFRVDTSGRELATQSSRPTILKIAPSQPNKKPHQFISYTQEGAEALEKAQKVNIYNMLLAKCDENMKEKEKMGSEAEQAEKRSKIKDRIKTIQKDLQLKSEEIRLKKEQQQKMHELEELRKEAKKKELLKQQIEKRKLEEENRHQRVRNIIDENRQRIQFQSELVKSGHELDPVYRRQLQEMTGSNLVNIYDKIEDFHYVQEMVENTEDPIIERMIRAHEEEVAQNQIVEQRKENPFNDGSQHGILLDYYDRMLKEKYGAFAEARELLEDPAVARMLIEKEKQAQALKEAQLEQERSLKKQASKVSKTSKASKIKALPSSSSTSDVVVRDSLQNLDVVQKQTIDELAYFNSQQEALQQKLRQQEELLALVEQDITTREAQIKKRTEDGNQMHSQQPQQEWQSQPELPSGSSEQAQVALKPSISQPFSSETLNKKVSGVINNQEDVSSQRISDIISSQLAGVDSYLELKKREMESASEFDDPMQPGSLPEVIEVASKEDGKGRQVTEEFILQDGSSGGIKTAVLRQ